MLNIYRLVVLILAVLAFSGSSLAQEASVQPVGVGKVGPTPSTLNVLYAGKPDSQRMKDFVAFLQKHFATVGTHDLQTDFADAAAAYDVVILDWTPIYPRNKAGLLDSTNPNAEPDNPKIAITAQFSKPVVMIGATGGQLIHQLGGQLKLAIDYRCLCLENYAHSTNLKHPIFEGPLPVEIKQETVEKPFGYFSYPGMKKIGETIQAWKVQDHTVPYCDPGLVSSAYVVSQAKDGEAISGGFSDKGPTSVAIARHGNYLMWGFSAPPDKMTDAGRAAFVNSVCYMDAFDGQLPKGVRGAYIDRDYGLYMVYHLRLTSPEYLAAVVQYHQKRAAISPLPPQALAQIGDDIPAYYKKLFQPAVTRTLDNIPTEIRRRCEDDSEKIIAYYTEKLRLPLLCSRWPATLAG